MAQRQCLWFAGTHAAAVFVHILLWEALPTVYTVQWKWLPCKGNAVGLTLSLCSHISWPFTLDFYTCKSHDCYLCADQSGGVFYLGESLIMWLKANRACDTHTSRDLFHQFEWIIFLWDLGWRETFLWKRTFWLNVDAFCDLIEVNLWKQCWVSKLQMEKSAGLFGDLETWSTSQDDFNFLSRNRNIKLKILSLAILEKASWRTKLELLNYQFSLLWNWLRIYCSCILRTDKSQQMRTSVSWLIVWRCDVLDLCIWNQLSVSGFCFWVMCRCWGAVERVLSHRDKSWWDSTPPTASSPTRLHHRFCYTLRQRASPPVGQGARLLDLQFCGSIFFLQWHLWTCVCTTQKCSNGETVNNFARHGNWTIYGNWTITKTKTQHQGPYASSWPPPPHCAKYCPKELVFMHTTPTFVMRKSIDIISKKEKKKTARKETATQWLTVPT